MQCHLRSLICSRGSLTIWTLPSSNWQYNVSQLCIHFFFDICMWGPTWPCEVIHHIPRCTNRNNHASWNTLVACKTRIIEFLWSPTAAVGIKICAIKFVHRVILLQTRGVSDPRVVFSLALSQCARFLSLVEFHSSKIGMIQTCRFVRRTTRLSRLRNWRTRDNDF